MSRSALRRDTALLWTLRACAAVCGAVVLFIAYFVVAEAAPALREVGLRRFLGGDPSWHPAAGAARGGVTEGTMRLVGVVKRWDDAKGFGFIRRSDGAGGDVFVHYKAISGTGRRSLRVPVWLPYSCFALSIARFIPFCDRGAFVVGLLALCDA